ncbi:MAG TPA: potassium transporter TrkG [Thermoanaerobaculia bacterium]|nr:potassium transporter TrkG [Thermoanaerobaculia bacterium]
MFKRTRVSRLGHHWADALLTQERLFVGSFLALIAAGAVGLRLTPAFYTGEPLGWLDALFTMTSAVCVTGLIVVDTATYFTPLGQGWILLFVQLGGLGMITFTTLIIVALGTRPSLHYEAAASAPASGIVRLDYRATTRSIFGFTLAFEVAGALLLWLAMGPRLGWREALWPAVFHAVSAFCNAGFSIYSDSLVAFRLSAFPLLVVMTLIVVGGMGFLTMADLRSHHWGRGRFQRLSLNTRLVLVTTLVLLAAGWAGYSLFEWESSLADLPRLDRVVNALFMSVTARTAGFNTVDYASMTDAGAFLTILLMFAGGSPGSTAGGLKTTTVAVIGLVAWSRLRGLRVTQAGARSIPEETVQRAVGLFVVVSAVVVAGLFALTVSEQGRVPAGAADRQFLGYVFEVASAFNTVGLSMDVTTGLSGRGRGAAIVLMFLGRVGPLAFAAAIARRAAGAASRLRYAFEEVVIG